MPATSPAPSWWRRPWAAGLALVALVLVAYQPIWHAGFIWDDDVFLVENPLIRSADGLWKFWFSTAAPDYFPASSTSLWLEWRLWGTHALGYHVTNVLLHAASVVLLWRVFAVLRLPGAWWIAALFALHPVNVESVAWITERKNTLALLFYVATLLAYVRFEDTGRRRWYAGAGVAFVLALLSKTAVAPLPVVLLGLAWWRRGRVERRDVVRSLPFFGAAAALAAMTIYVQYHQAIGDTVVRTDGFAARLAGAGWAVWFYLSKALLPVNLSFVYPRWRIDPAKILSFVPIALLAVAFAIAWRRRAGWGKPFLLGGGYFVVLLLPVLGFLNIFFMRYSLVADHWQYFALIGPVALVVVGIDRGCEMRFRPTPWLKPAILTGCLLVLAALTWRQAGTYANVETLWRATIARTPSAFLAQNNLGLLLLSQGRVDEGIAHCEQALAIKPDYAEAHSNLASAYLEKGRTDDALAHFTRALGLQPRSPEIHNNLGNVLLRKGRVDEALSHYRKAIELRPTFAVAHCNVGAILLERGERDGALTHYQAALGAAPAFNLARYNVGYILLQKGEVDRAIALFEGALATEPDLAPAHLQLGHALAKKGRLDDAIAHFERLLALQPDYVDAHATLAGLWFQKGSLPQVVAHSRAVLTQEPDNVMMLSSLAWLLATSPDATVRNGPEAVRYGERANKLTNGQDPMTLRALAAAYAEIGRTADAVITAQQALHIAEAKSATALAEALRAQLARHQSGAPWREPK